MTKVYRVVQRKTYVVSKVKVQNPIVHIPTFNIYQMSGSTFKTKIEALGLTVPMGMLDGEYFYTDLEGWGKVLLDLIFKSNLYKSNKFDCDNYALKAMNICAERYGLNTLGMVIGDIPEGRHAFNIFYHGDGFMLWEPNEGFPFSGSPFDLGEYDYHPEMVLI